jgi:hypothetical protein
MAKRTMSWVRAASREVEESMTDPTSPSARRDRGSSPRAGSPVIPVAGVPVRPSTVVIKGFTS